MLSAQAQEKQRTNQRRSGLWSRNQSWHIFQGEPELWRVETCIPVSSSSSPCLAPLAAPDLELACLAPSWGVEQNHTPHASPAGLGWKASRRRPLWPDHPFFNPEQTLKCGLCYFKTPGLDRSLLRSAWLKEKKNAGQRSDGRHSISYFQPPF